jgi:beta-barrel assembly-enhancing protease
MKPSLGTADTWKLLYKRTAIVLLGCSTIVLCTVCSSLNIFPVSDDQKLGAQFDQEIRADPKTYPIHSNPAIRTYIQNMVNTIVRAPEVKYRNTFAYKVEIINDDKTVNAFCTPGGYIYVYTGLLKLADNEATIAGVIGHEIAHAERRHSTSRMTKAFGLQMLLEMVLGNNPNRNVELAANAFSGLGLLQNSRSDEEEADDFSFKYLRSTQWYPGGILYFFEKVRGRPGSTIERLLSTHPLPEDRIKATNERLKKANMPPPTEAQLNMRGYQDFKRTL